MLLSACGFHLRGDISLPPSLQPLALIVEQSHNPLLLQAAQQLLDTQHIRTADKEHARFWLVLENEGFNEQVAHISASTTPRQYNLQYSLQYSLIDTRGKPIIPVQTIHLTQSITVNNDRLLGSNFETLTIANEMREKALYQILEHIHMKGPAAE
ncbi:MAG: hypothetical protein Q8R79_06885 [Legionellaceae bacterium]|nr:hypothetical protein [Legionellaceae bacterium]